MMQRIPRSRVNRGLVILATVPQEGAVEMFEPNEWLQQARPEQAVCKTTKQSTETTDRVYHDDTAEVPVPCPPNWVTLFAS